MDKKKLYLIIGCVVLAILIVVGIAIGVSVGKSNTDETTVPTTSEPVGGEESVTDPTIGDDVTTDPTVGDNTTKPDDTTETTKPTVPDDTEQTTPDVEDTTFPTGPDGTYDPSKYKPEVDLKNPADILDIANDEKLPVNNDGYATINAEYNDTPVTIVVDTNSDIAFVDYSKTEDSATREVYNTETGELIESITTYDNGCIVAKCPADFGYYENDTVRHIYREYDKSNNVISEVTYKMVDGKAYVLSGFSRKGITLNVRYVSENSPIRIEMIWDGPSYWHCKWNGKGDSPDDLIYIELHDKTDGTYSKQEGEINLYMLGSPPNPSMLFSYLN